ncbi:dTDP-4-dehydrorhamnose reductase [Balneolales bacterium ANBcel1]|nr:dTDP-4-dehydrorhamnose reductase [Balneolales bacterium ANBcel1]
MTPENQRWLLLGAGGQLGAEWARYLKTHGYAYKACTRKEVDITRPDEVRGVIAKFRPDIVINAAAYTAVDQAEEDAVTAGKVNSVAAGNLARLCADHGTLLVHYSTDYVFAGKLEDRAAYPEGYPEAAEPHPVNRYGETKWMGEKAIQQERCPHLIVRVSWLCGHYGNNFIHTMLRLAREKKQINVVNDQHGCPTFTRPAVLNTMALIEAEQRGTWHISSAGETTWYDFAKAVFEKHRSRGNGTDRNHGPVSVIPIPTSEYPTKAARPEWSRLCIKRLAEVKGSRILPWQEELAEFMRDLPD